MVLQVMAYSDFAFDDLGGKSEDARRFPSHKEVTVCATLCSWAHLAAWQPQLLPVHAAKLRAGPLKFYSSSALFLMHMELNVAHPTATCPYWCQGLPPVWLQVAPVTACAPCCLHATCCSKISINTAKLMPQ